MTAMLLLSKKGDPTNLIGTDAIFDGIDCERSYSRYGTKTIDKAGLAAAALYFLSLHNF